MAGNFTRSKCFRLTVILAVLLGLFAVSTSSAFDEEELGGNFGYEGENSAYPSQFEQTRSAESDEEEDLRYYGFRYKKNKNPKYVNNGHSGYSHNQKTRPVRPQPYYSTCRDAPQCKQCKAPKVPAYQPPVRSVRVESSFWEHQFDENLSSRGEYELRYYMKQYQHAKPSLPQCNKECKIDIPEVPVKKPYYHQTA